MEPKSSYTQNSQLLSAVFRERSDEERLCVLHIGPARGDTLEFFSAFRCRLHIVDLFAELPLPGVEDTNSGLVDHMAELLQLSAESLFDVCLFWDIFNYLDEPAVEALAAAVRPHLKSTCRAHAFSVHSANTPESSRVYGIESAGLISARRRPGALPGYRPHTQNRLQAMLHGLAIERSVLLPDRRLELLLGARPTGDKGGT